MRAKAEGLIADGNEAGTGHRVTAGKQRHLMPLTHELFGQVGDDALCTTVKPGRHAVEKWRYLCNPHLVGVRWLRRAASPGTHCASCRRIRVRTCSPCQTDAR